MARDYGKVWFSLFASEDFTSMPRIDKLLYVALIGQQSLNSAGITPLYLRRWARAIRDGDQMPTDQEVMESLRRLEGRRYTYTDDYTGELLVRTFIRNDGVDKQPNVLKGAMRDLASVQSPKLAAVMLQEMDLITIPVITSTKNPESAKRMQRQLDNLVVAAQGHLKGLAEGLAEPFTKPFTEGFAFPQVAEGLPEGFPEGLPKPPVVVEVEVAKSPSPDGYVGRGATDELESEQPSNDPPNPRCPKHLNDPTDKPCRACGKAREDRQAWDATQKRKDAQRRSEAVKADALLRAHETAECPLCDEDGYRNALPCSHDPYEDERRERGAAMVRAILAKGKSA